MKVLIISQNSQLYSTSRLLQEARSLNIPASHQNIYESGHWEEAQKCPASVVFNRYSGTLYDDFDLQLAKNWSDLGTMVLNPVEDCRSFRDKLSAHILLSSLGVSTPQTKAFRGPISSGRIEQLEFRDASDVVKDEYLIKPTRGNKGHGISLCRGIDSLMSQLEAYYYLKDQKFIIQPRLKIKREFRLFFIGDHIYGAFEKNPKDKYDFRLNADRSDCYKIEPKNLTDELISFYNSIRRNTDLFYGGIDIAETDNGLYLLEVNPTPGFETLESICDLNVAKEILCQVQSALIN
ncbi:RimK family alpha-L-glutamate ligase [Halobacteriovorax sp. HLS]|uniref:ATP-grasp domain-containing protein n=1 Tax=Halobacteriovorax sp. HLS TaxID=2234000 RepID=UPI000FD8950E|nr:hypothetical protein [Halobacteriovorax sp. HLS]